MADMTVRGGFEEYDGNQTGDPDKAIAVILRAVDADDAPLHLRSARSRMRSPSGSWRRFAAISMPGANSRSPRISIGPERRPPAPYYPHHPNRSAI